MTTRSLPVEITTGCPELDLVWREYAGRILSRPGILIPDTEDDLNWHAFLGHSIDMQGFRAAEFAGVDDLTRSAPNFVSLRDRGLGVEALATLWSVPAIQHYLLANLRGIPLTTTLEVLEREGGDAGASLADAYRWFPWRKFHWSVRALLENSAVLGRYDFSFRNWLERTCGELVAGPFPPPDFTVEVAVDGRSSSLEKAIRTKLQQTFYMVGPALAPYMICDWQLWLWSQGRTTTFATFKLDSFHEQFVAKYGRGVVPTSEDGFTDWWWALYPDVPPRIANECVWLGIEEGLV